MLPWLVGAYLLALLFVTLAVRLRHGRLGDRQRFVADGSLGGLITGCSLAATSIGGSSIVVATSLVYRHGLPGIWVDLAGAIGFLLLGLLLAGRVRATGVASIAELAGLRYGPALRRLVALVVLVVELAWLALQAKAVAAVIGPALPRAPEWVLLAASIGVVIAYTWVGGQFAVAYVDLVQILIMIAGLGLMAPLASLRALGPRAAELRLEFPVSAGFGWTDLLGFLLLIGLPHLVGSDLYAKVLSARDGRAAARGALLAALLKAIFAAALAVTALCGARLLPGLASPEELLPALIQQVLPSGLAAVVVIAVIATMQSTASQVLLSAVTMLGNDLLPGTGVAGLATLGLGLISLALAALSPTVVDLMRVAYSLFAGGLSLPLLTAVFPELPLSRSWVGVAVAAGSGIAAGVHVLRLVGRTLPGDPVLWGVAACLLCLLVAAARARRAE